MAMTDERLAEIAQLLERITWGGWFVDRNHDGLMMGVAIEVLYNRARENAK